MERAGPTIGNIIQNKNFWKNENCGRDHCKPCETKPGSCRLSHVTYRVKCLTCLEATGKRVHYVGESHRSLLDRSREHESEVRSKSESNAMARHWIHEHPDLQEPPEYSFEVIKKHRTSLERQLNEALTIDQEDCDLLLNAKGEWGFNLIPKLETEDLSRFRKAKINENNQAKRNSQGHTINSTGASPHESSTFQGQYRMRKRLRLTETKASEEQQVKTNVCQSGLKARNGYPVKSTSDQDCQPYRSTEGHQRARFINENDVVVQAETKDCPGLTEIEQEPRKFTHD